MKIKEEYILQNIADKWVVINTNAKSNNFNKILSLNDSGKYLWEQLEKGVEVKDLVNGLIDYFKIDKDLAIKDVESFIFKLQELECIENEEK